MSEHPSCQQLLEGLSAYIDHEASEAICQEIERHLEECENCRIMLDTLQKTISLYQIIDTADHIPSDMQERLLKKLSIDEIQPDNSSDLSIDQA